MPSPGRRPKGSSWLRARSTATASCAPALVLLGPRVAEYGSARGPAIARRRSLIERAFFTGSGAQRTTPLQGGALPVARVARPTVFRDEEELLMKTSGLWTVAAAVPVSLIVPCSSSAGAGGGGCLAPCHAATP